jgi:23S rRNA pseudouridine1911/1915/1917 synthase
VTPRLELVVPAVHSGRRVDEVVSSLAPNLSCRQAKRLCLEGRVLVEGRRVKKGQFLQAGAHLVVLLSPEVVMAEPEAPLVVCATSPDWVIVNKPPRQPTAARRTDEGGSLVSALVGRFPEMQGVGYEPREPGIVHRLDNGTSGLVLAARHGASFELLRAALQSGQIAKTYTALVVDRGLPDEGRITFPIAPHPRDPRRSIAVVGALREPPPPPCAAGDVVTGEPPPPPCAAGDVVTGEPPPPPYAVGDVMTDEPLRRQRPSTTCYRVQHRRAGIALVEVTATVATRHQIRVHFAALGHPLVNDVLYGAPEVSALGPERHGLHAARLVWEGTSPVEGFDVTAPLFADLAGFWAGL